MSFGNKGMLAGPLFNLSVINFIETEPWSRLGCPSSASVCRRNGGEVDVLGIASTQRMTTSGNVLYLFRP